MSRHICILMATRNGARHVQAQLESFVAQTHTDWSLRISDDGSQDDTTGIIKTFAQAHPDRDIRLYAGPGQGSAANFLSLLARDDLPEGAWLALSDQDDVWMADRLDHALNTLALAGGEGMQVYASRTILTDASLVPRKVSRARPRAPAFANALVQNVLAGNTILVNWQAGDLLRRTAPAALAAGVAHHDWWIYLLLSGAGAVVINDDRPGLFYRQHDDNLLGANRGASRAVSRFAMIWDGQYADWVHRNLAALGPVQSELTGPNRQMLHRFESWVQGSGRRWCGGGLSRTGVWRQTLWGGAMLRLAAALGRL